MLPYDYLRELSADLHRVGRSNARLYGGIVTLFGLLALTICWHAIALIGYLLSDAGVPVSGVVRYEGAILDRGRISFYAQDAARTDRPQAETVIVAGHYNIPSPPGLKAGKYLVRIWSPRAVPHNGITTPPAQERIPPKFNSEASKIIDVQRYGWNVHDFDLD